MEAPRIPANSTKVILKSHTRPQFLATAKKEKKINFYSIKF